MKMISFSIRHIALAAATLLAGVCASAQTTITADESWYGNSGTQMTGWTTFGSDHFYKQGGTRTPDNSRTVTVNGTNYPTYDLRDTSSDAVKFYLGQGAGTVKVYYNDAVTNVTRNITRTLRGNDSNCQPVGTTTRSENNTFTTPSNWSGGFIWSFADKKMTINSFSLTLENTGILPNDNKPATGTVTDTIGTVRIVVRFKDPYTADTYEECSAYSTKTAAEQTISVSIPAEKQSWQLKEIYIQSVEKGVVKLKNATMQGSVTEQQKSSREATTNLRPTDDNVQLYGNTTANGNTVLFGGGWTGFGWMISNTTTKLKRFTLILDNSSIAQNERGKVRVVIRYRNQGYEDQSNPVEYLWSDDAANGNITLTVTPTAGSADYYIREIYIQNGNAGRINIASAELVTEVETEGSATPVLKKNQNENYSPLDYSNGQNGTKILTYNFNNTGNRNEYWISGGQIGAIVVDFDETTVITAPDLVPITQDFLWYYNGGGIYNPGYSNNSRLYRFLNGNTIFGQDTEIYVNGELLDNDGSTDNASKHSYRLTDQQALGFKLDPSKKYRIRVLSDKANPLHAGGIALTSTAVTASNSVLVRSNANAPTTTYLTTYEIEGSGDTYWIRSSSGNINLGGFEVLPVENVSMDLSGKATIPASATSWWFDDYMQDQNNEAGNLNSGQIVRAGDKGSYVYISGPDMPLHKLNIADHRTMRVNDGTMIGFRIPAGSRLSFQYAGDSGTKIKVIHNGQELTGTASGGFDTFNYPAAEVGADTDETIWITGYDANYIFFSGFTVTPIAANDAPDPVKIDNDYIWYSGETISASSLFGSNYLANNGVGKSVIDGEDVKVDGRIIGVYDLSRATGNFRLNLKDEIGTGEIRVFWKKADLATPENLDLAANLPAYDWADFHNITSNSAQTITYSYTNNPGTDYEYPARGYTLTPSVGKYDKVTITLSGNPNEFYWHIVVIYDNGNDGACPYTTGTTLSADIDPERTLVAVLIQGAIGPNETKTITVGSVVFNRLGKAAGTVENTTLYSFDSNNGEVAVGSRFTVEDTDYITYRFDNNSPREYHIKGGFVAAVEVLCARGWQGAGNLAALVDNPGSSSNDLPFIWNVESGLGTTINNGSTPMVLNAKTLHNDSKVLVHADGADFYGVPRQKEDLAINATLVNANRSVLLDKYHAVAVKLPAGGKYKVTAYWSKCDDKGGIRFIRRDGYSRQPDSSIDFVQFFDQGPSSVNYDLTDATADQVIWISGAHTDADGNASPGGENVTVPVYFSGFKVETYLDYSIEIDDRQPGIFTGKYKFGGQQQKKNGQLVTDDEGNPVWVENLEPDTEEKLLVYCSDNGTYESFRVPRVYFRDAVDPTNDTDITTSARMDNILKIELKGATNCLTPTIVADGRIGTKDVYRVNGFEDTDNDRVYKVSYTYTRTYTEGGEEKTETYKDHYYIWYANYLKIGWWTNREAKLIVGTSDSYNDPDHIIVGDFYISSGETADFYYDVINPGKDTAGNVVGYEVATVNGSAVTYGYGGAVFDEAEWTFTTDNGSTQTKNRPFVAGDTEKKSNGIDPEEFSWTKMNDHKNHLADAISLAYPTDDSAWGGAEVVKTITFRAKRKGGWPDWTARLTFHFVPAPTLSAAGPTTYKTLTITPATRLAGESTDGKLYYTTDGTNPTTLGGIPTNQTFVYDASNKPVNRQMTVYYAAERVEKPDTFYIHNPYTTHIEGKTMNDLMNDASNKATWFIAVSKELEAPVVDPMVEYVNSDRNIISKDRNNNLTTTTAFSEWGIAGDAHTVSALGVGGFLYKYPFAQQRRDVMVLFGNHGKRVYRKDDNVNAFWNVGVYWGVDENDGFAEHFDALLYKWKTMGYNYDSTHGGKPEDELGQTSENGNPQTECNGGIGSEYTENGGLWLAPITGDFLRFEPEYDGVITVWMRTNGAAQGDEYYGNITRRPVYVVDENGKVMKRSTVKPTQDDYFGIDGLYAEICTNRSTVRHDCRTDWVNGLAAWKSGYAHNDDEGLPGRNMATFRLYNYWYGFPLFQNKNSEHHTPRGVAQNETNGNHYRFSMDVADSWVSRTANVKSVQCEFNSIVYHSQQLHDDIEKSQDIVFVHGDGDNYQEGNVYSGDKFALYGWEIPSFNVVRYRFPVKAGKSYYIGGRGTKNGYMGMKFEPLPANYNPRDYRNTDYRLIFEGDSIDKKASHTAFTAYSGVTGSYSYSGYSADAARASYNNKVEMQAGVFDDANANYVPTYDLWEEPPTGMFNSWYGEQGVNGHANVLFQNFDNTDFWGNGQRELVNENSVVGHTCNVRLYRKFTKGYWHPIVLPFSVSETRMKEIFGDDVQVLYLDPWDNTLKTSDGKNNTEGLGSNGHKGSWVSALNPAVSLNNLRFTYHHYQMLYANVPAFVCPGGNRKVNGQWTADWTEFGTTDKTGEDAKAQAVLFERVTVDRSNLTDNNYDKIGYKIGETDDWEYWVTGSYTPGMKGTEHGVYYLTNELTDQNGDQHMRAVIYHSPNGKTLKATRCWIAVRKKTDSTIPWGQPPLLTNVGFTDFQGDDIDIDDIPSGIKDVMADEIIPGMSSNDENVYDVLGRVVGHGGTEGLPTGVYIYRGHKTYVR